jgi:hypothetical protein
MDNLYRHARRYTTGRTVLDGLAIIFLCCSAAFWLMLHWTALVGPGLPSLASAPQAVVALVMTAVYALALPLLLSMLVPTTPAGQALQKTQWRTVGFPVIICSVVLLGYWAVKLVRAWFGAQPTIAEAGIDPAYVVASIVGFIVIPALAWVQVSPERWLREIEQAHQVRKLEMLQRGELAIVKARLLWAEQRAAVSYAKLLPAEQQEVRDTLRGLLMGIADTQRSIARTMGISADVERSIMGDQEIADSLDYVSQQLERPAASLDRALTWIHDGDRESETNVDNINIRPHVNPRLQSSEPPGAVRQSRAESDSVYDAIARDLPPVFTAGDVSARMQWKDKRPAQRVIHVWVDQGLASEVRLGRYQLTE